MPKKFIIAEMRPDWVSPCKEKGDRIPVVIDGNHPRFHKGSRFDYGFLQGALRENYSVTINPEQLESDMESE